MLVPAPPTCRVKVGVRVGRSLEVAWKVAPSGLRVMRTSLTMLPSPKIVTLFSTVTRTAPPSLSAETRKTAALSGPTVVMCASSALTTSAGRPSVFAKASIAARLVKAPVARRAQSCAA